MTDVQVESTQPRKRRRKQRQQTEQPDQDQQTDFINFDAVVTELKQIVARGSSDAWRVAELAYRVQPLYGDKTLAKLAKKIGGIAACTLERRRAVYRKWKEIAAAPPESFAVAQELADNPDAARIITDKPNISSREARKKTQEWKEQQQQADPNFEVKKRKKWFEDFLLRVSKIVRDAEIINLAPKQRRHLKKAITQPAMLDELPEGERALKTIYEFLKRLVDEPA